MTAECCPPEGTPDGTVCWLFRYTGAGEIRERQPWLWRDRKGWKQYWVQHGDAHKWLTKDLAAWGWRFHSLATPPQEPTP